MSATIERQDGATETTPDPLSDLAFVGTLLSISKSTRALSALLLNEIELHVGQDQLLIAIDVNKPVSVRAVSVDLNVRPSTVSKMVDRLVVKGFVERGLDSHDARLIVLHLTPECEAKRREILALWRRLQESLLLSGELWTSGELPTPSIPSMSLSESVWRAFAEKTTARYSTSLPLLTPGRFVV